MVQRRQAKKDEDEGFTREGFGIKAAPSKQMDEPGIIIKIIIKNAFVFKI